MSSGRHISFRAWLLWLCLICAAWWGGSRILSAVDSAVFNCAGHLCGWDAEQHAQLHRPGTEIQTETVLTEKKTMVCPTVGMLELSDTAVADTFAALPLQAQDMAVLLRYISAAGIRTVGISAPLTWQEQPGDMARQMFCNVLQNFGSAVVGLRGRTAAQADFTPENIRAAAIPADRVEGDPTGLPAANKPMPNGLADSPDALQLNWAPDWLEDEPLTQKASAVQEISFPLLMRWNGETIPTLPLRLALLHAGLTPADVGVRLGRDIRFAGRTLPLDEHGRTRLTIGKTCELKPADVVGNTAFRPEQGIGAVLVAQPMQGKSNPARLQSMAATLSQLMASEKTEYIKTQQPCGGIVLEQAPWQNSLGNVLIVLAVAAVLLRILPYMPVLLRLMSIAALAGTWVWLVRSCTEAGTWFFAGAAVLCVIIFSAALFALRPTERNYFRRRRR